MILECDARRKSRSVSTSKRITNPMSPSLCAAATPSVSTIQQQSCRKKLFFTGLFSPQEVSPKEFASPARRRSAAKRQSSTSTRRPRRKRRRANVGSTEDSTLTSKGGVTSRKKKAKRRVNHKLIHDRAVARVASQAKKIELSDFTMGELCSMTTHLLLHPAKNENNRVTKQLRYQAWHKYVKNNQAYRDTWQTLLAVSGADLENQHPEEDSTSKSNAAAPTPKQQVKRRSYHKLIHDRAVARVAGQDKQIELTDFTPGELSSMTTHLRLDPARNQNNRVTKELRFQAWREYANNNRAYNDICADLSVSGAHLEDQYPEEQKWPLGTKIAKLFGDKIYEGTVTRMGTGWMVQFEDDKPEEWGTDEMRSARCSYLRQNDTKYDDQTLRIELVKNSWPVGTEIVKSFASGFRVGCVTSVVRYWFVVYKDDNDSEELTEEQMKTARSLYHSRECLS